MKKVLPEGMPAATEKLLLASGAASEITISCARLPGMVAVYESFDWMLPDQFEAFGYRKAFFESQVKEAIESGSFQVLVLGAGYDTLCWRLASEYAGRVRFFEIDHPATATSKAKGVERMGHPDNLHLLAGDLSSQKLFDLLSANASWDEDAQTIIIAEGLLMYLSLEAVEDLLCQCALVTGEDSRIVFSYLPEGGDGQPYAGRWTNLLLWLQRVAGEPWLSCIDPNKLVGFLKKTGWNLVGAVEEQYDQCGVEKYAVAEK
jgi:methyltransferase (TIGR00027 family)